MTPFEKAKANVKHLAEGLSLMELVDTTIRECQGLPEEDQEVIWTAIFLMLQAGGKMDVDN